jgi:four helix bundle protein
MNETAKRRDGETAKKPIRHFRELNVYQNALAIGLGVYQLTQTFPNEERYALTDQVRRSSRSICANVAEAWRKRRYEAAFVAKLSDAEAEAAETQVHLEFAVRHRYIGQAEFGTLDDAYEKIIGQLVRMIDQPQKWLIKNLRHLWVATKK